MAAEADVPESFSVFYLGTEGLIDTTEGNYTAENAASLVGRSFGGPGDALAGRIQTMSPGSTGFGANNPTVYDMARDSDTFRIDGGPDQVFDGTAVYNATITYVDGSTANITAVVFQDNAGNTYLAPEFSRNLDQNALEAMPLRSLTLDGLVGNRYSGLTGIREETRYVTCFTPGARIATPFGPRRVEHLRPGDLIATGDNGSQPVRWIGRARAGKRAGHGRAGVRGDDGPADALIPVLIQPGALGAGLPVRPLLVSPQHRFLVRSEIARAAFGVPEVLIAARKLLPLPGVRLAPGKRNVTYIHLLMDRHEIIFADGVPTESLLAGPMARRMLGAAQMRELDRLFPDIPLDTPAPARPIAAGQQAARLVARHRSGRRKLLSA